MLLTATPIAWYHFNEGSGTTSADASGNGHTATLTGDAAWQSQAVGFTTGTAGADLHLDGAGAADLGNPSDLNFAGQITISAWFKPTSTAGTQDIIAHGYGSGPSGPYAEVYMRIYNGEYAVGSCDGGWNYQAVMPMPTSDLNTWVNLTGVYDGYGWVLYRNGLQVDDQPETLGSMMVNADWMIGSSAVPSDPRYFTGDVDEVKIFNQALYGQDILDQMGYQFPALHASAAAPPVEGAAVALNLSATYASGVPNTVSSWTVDWGDGTATSPDMQSVTGQAPSPTHTYGIAGNYVVQVTATDAQGIHLLNAAQLDTSFGTGGVATVPSGGWVPMSIITQQGFGSPAQEFYLAAGSINGNFGVARFTTNGVLDPNFGTGGVSTISLAGYQLNGETVAVDDQNRILLAGYAAPVGGGMDQFAVARFNYDGTPDTSFGTNGLATLGAAGYDDFAFALYPYLDDNGDEKIMLGGRASGQGALVQFNDDGTPNTSFGYGGAIVPGGTMHTIYTLYRLSNGQFLGGGFSWGANGTTDYAAARYKADGTLDTTFGVNGVASTSFYDMDIAYNMAVGPTGQILLTGRVPQADGSGVYNMAMATFTPDGQPDDSFGTNGTVVEYWGPVGFLFGGQYEPDGKIIVTGTANGDVVTQRFNPDGTVDPTFNGSTLDARWVGGWYYGNQVLIDSDGQAITLGNAGDPLDSWVLTRRLADVTLTVSPAISDLTATPVSPTEINLTWDQDAPDITSIEIDRSPDGTTWQTLTKTLPTTATSYSDTTGLTETTQYYYRILTTRNGYPNEEFDTDTWTMAIAPSGLSSSIVSGGGGVTLSWTNNSAGQIGFTINRSDDGGATYHPVDVVDSSTTTYTDTTPPDGTSVIYQIQAMDGGGGESLPLTSDPIQLPIAPPEDLSVSAVSDTEIDLAWDNGSDVATGYIVERSEDGNNFTQVTTTSETTYQDTGLNPDTAYIYRIRSTAGSLDPSDPSSTQTATTDPAQMQLTLGGDSTVGRGDSYTISLNHIFPPGTPDTDWPTSETVDWGDGNTDTVNGYRYSYDHTYDTRGVYTITAASTTPAGTFSAESKVIVGTNPISMSLNEDYSQSEFQVGDTVLFTGNLVGNALDLLKVNEWVVDWDDGSGPQTISPSASDPTDQTFSHSFANGGTTFDVAITAVTDQGLVTNDEYVRVQAPAGDANYPTDPQAGVNPTNDGSDGGSGGNGGGTGGGTGSSQNFTIDPCAGVVLDYPFSIGWADGGSTTVTGPGTVSHTYFNNGQYHVTITDASGTIIGGNWVTENSNFHPTLAPISDQIVSTGDAVTVSSTASEVYNQYFEGYVDWGDGTGLHPTDIGRTSSTATLTAKLDAAGDPGQHTGSLILCSVDQPNNHSGVEDSKSFNVDVWGAKLGDGSNNIIMQASDDGTQNLVPLTLYYPRPAGVATNLKLTISNEGEAVVWDTNDPEDEQDDNTPILGTGDSTVTLNAAAGDLQQTLWVGATKGTTTLNDLFFTLAAETPGPTTGPTTKPSTNPATPVSVKITSNSSPNGDNGNNGDVTSKTRKWLVGQMVWLSADVVAPPQVLAGATFKWTVPGSTLRDYQITQAGATSSAVAVPLANDNGNAPADGDPTGLVHREIMFFWVTTSSLAQPDVDDVSVQVSKLAINGNPADAMTEKTTFNVYSPVATVTPVVGAVGFGVQSGSYWAGLLPKSGNTLGMQWSIGVSTPNQGFGVGTFHDTQLANVQVDWADKGTWFTTSSNGKYVLDTADPYLGDTNITQYNVPGKGWSTDGRPVNSGDSPSIVLTATASDLQEQDTFKTYVMYLPPGPDSEWVPLSEMDWGFLISANLVAKAPAARVPPQPGLPIWYIHNRRLRGPTVSRASAEPIYSAMMKLR